MATHSSIVMDRPFERVYTVTDYYDGPRGGVADFDGSPHVYRGLFSVSADDWQDDHFELGPLSPEGFALALEDWAMWVRFEAGFRAGAVPMPEDPADWGVLPAERVRHRDIQA